LTDPEVVFCAADSKDFMILACIILIGQQGVMDRQTDGWMDAFAIAKTGNLNSNLRWCLVKIIHKVQQIKVQKTINYSSVTKQQDILLTEQLFSFVKTGVAWQ